MFRVGLYYHDQELTISFNRLFSPSKCNLNIARVILRAKMLIEKNYFVIS